MGQHKIRSRALQYLSYRKAAEQAPPNSEALFRAISDASPLGIYVSDWQGDCVYSNAAFQRISGMTPKQTQGMNWNRMIHPEDRRRVFSEWRKATMEQVPFLSVFRFQREDGSIVWMRVNGDIMRDGCDQPGHVLTIEDITECKSIEFGLRKAEEALYEERSRAQFALNSIGDAVVTTNPLGNLVYMNPAAESMTGWTLADASGRPFAQVFRIIERATRRAVENPARRAIEAHTTVTLAADCILLHRDGSEIAIEVSAAPIRKRDGRVGGGAVMVFRDVSQTRAEAEKMAHLARHDYLTGLPNRLLLTERLSQAIGMARRHHKQAALLFLDLDDFKNINDSLGHAIGDQLLRSVAARLLANVRDTDTVFRQGGDEFVILLTEIEQPRDAALVAENLRAMFDVPHYIAGHELRVSLSIGISIFPDDGSNSDAMMQNADTAMFHAKASGRNNHCFFGAEMNIHGERRSPTESAPRLRRYPTLK